MSDRIYKQSLSVGLIIALTKMGEAVYRFGRNDIHIPDDIDLSDMTDKEKCNFHGNYSKLRFFALIAKVMDGDRHIAGHWLLTHRGALFLRNKISIPKSVFTLDNHIVQRGEIYGETGLIKEVFIKDIWREYNGEKWQQFFPWESREPVEHRQLTMSLNL